MSKSFQSFIIVIDSNFHANEKFKVTKLCTKFVLQNFDQGIDPCLPILDYIFYILTRTLEELQKKIICKLIELV